MTWFPFSRGMGSALVIPDSGFETPDAAGRNRSSNDSDNNKTT